MPATTATQHSGNTAASTLGGFMHTSTATQLATGDIVYTGHGFGEAPAVVASAGRFTSRMAVVAFADGRTITVPNGHLFDRAPRATESLAGLVDYDDARELRAA